MSELQVVNESDRAELGDAKDGRGKRRKQSERLEDAVAGADLDLFHDAEFRTYATFERDGHLETWPIRSAGFRRYVSYLYYRAEGEPVRAQVLSDFLGVLDGRAQFDGRQGAVFVRIGSTQDGGIAIDLGDAAWSVIEVRPGGWRRVASSPVRFVRPRGFQPLPAPEPGGSLDLLRPFVNVADDEQWKLLAGYLVGMYRPIGPYAVLVLNGEQGAAKSTAMRVLRRMIDPRQTLDRAAPRDNHELAIHAMHHWVVALDNMSELQDWVSDALARLATGSGFSARELYSDSDEFSFMAARPVMINGIGEVVNRSDLLDRAVLVNLAPISEDRRRLEAEFWTEFETARPLILGAVLDAIAGALDRVASIKLATWPRMADFARFVTAAEPALGWKEGAFLAAYFANRGAAHELALEADPVAVALRDLVTGSTPVWEGRSTDLLARLAEVAGETATRRRDWPKAAHALSTRLERLAPNLRAIGIDVGHDRSAVRRTIRVARVDNGASSASSASQASPTDHDAGRPNDADDADDAASQASTAHPDLRLTMDWSVVSDAISGRPRAVSGPPCPGCARPMVATNRVDRPFVCTSPAHSQSADARPQA